MHNIRLFLLANRSFINEDDEALGLLYRVLDDDVYWLDDSFDEAIRLPLIVIYSNDCVNCIKMIGWKDSFCWIPDVVALSFMVCLLPNLKLNFTLLDWLCATHKFIDDGK